MKRLLLAFVLLGLALPAHAQGTAFYQEYMKALTQAGKFGMPRYATANLPTCNTSNLAAKAWDTTASLEKTCDGATWNAVAGGITIGTTTITGGTSGSLLYDNGGLIGETTALPLTVANAGVTGTTLNKLAKLTGAPSTAVIAATTDTQGIVGIVIGGAGTTGNALIARAGQASCVFDGATTAGDYVVISPTVAGDCHDTGSANYPTTGGQVLGRVLSTNGAGGTYAMTVHMGTQALGATAGQSATFGSTTTAGTSTTVLGTTMSGSSATSNFLNITGTSPTTLTAETAGVTFDITGAGSSAQRLQALRVRLLAGWTGAEGGFGLFASNFSAGTGNNLVNGQYNAGSLGIYVGSGGTVGIGVLGEGAGTPTNQAGVVGFSTNGTNRYGVVGYTVTGGTLQSAGYFKLGSAQPGAFQTSLPGVNAALVADNGDYAGDIFVARDNSATVFAVNDGGNTTQTGANGATRVHGVISELMTLSTVGTTTDSAANLLTADSIIEAVTCRVTTTITTATNWSVGDATTAARFSSANSTLTAGTTSVGLNHQQGSVATDAAGPVQVTAAKLRITTTGTPGAGAIRCTVFYTQFTAPTS